MDFNELVKTTGGLLSFNNFLSTSLDREVSLAFAESNHSDPHLIGVLFETTSNPSTSTTVFAQIHDVSYFEGEKEILFSVNSIFRIGSIKEIDGNNRLWQVDLTLTSDNDPELLALTEGMRQEIYSYIDGWNRLALEIRQKALPSNHPDLATSYDNIGVAYSNVDDYLNALSSHQKALNIREKALPSDHPELSPYYNVIAEISLPSNHPYVQLYGDNLQRAKKKV
ncbi:unnamed protein product [Rotaria sp. Silwood1]|nr:unnamed protein product [Rotaria sp. Silwood1]CAF3416548.1 unnamed protein product [Rotaria sp. Silwood1]CAF3434339.1 unnamed protein product [Rotaria sp. Silwood1]CAF4595101.1 unnamed protein product [Rotaria sp. Silwood1]CAF4620158.1 unnamed protein product [Rotaria sp. Silwood1]